MPKRRRVKRGKKVKNKLSNKTGINININSNNRRKTQPQVNKSSSRGYNPFPVAHPIYLPQVTQYRDTAENISKIQKQLADFTKDKMTTPKGDWSLQQGKGTFESMTPQPKNLGDDDEDILRDRIRRQNIRFNMDRARERQLEGMVEDQRRMRMEEHFRQSRQRQHDTEASDDDKIVLG